MHGDMKLKRAFLENTAVGVKLPGSGFEVFTVHPVIIIAAKMSNDVHTAGFRRPSPPEITDIIKAHSKSLPPRIADIFDTVAILCSPYRRLADWEGNLQIALEGLEANNREAALRRLQLIEGVTDGLDFEKAFLAISEVWEEDMGWV